MLGTLTQDVEFQGTVCSSRVRSWHQTGYHRVVHKTLVPYYVDMALSTGIETNHPASGDDGSRDHDALQLSQLGILRDG